MVRSVLSCDPGGFAVTDAMGSLTHLEYTMRHGFPQRQKERNNCLKGLPGGSLQASGRANPKQPTKNHPQVVTGNSHQITLIHFRDSTDPRSSPTSSLAHMGKTPLRNSLRFFDNLRPRFPLTRRWLLR